MKLFIKNMVCARCKQAVSSILSNNGLRPLQVELGEVDIEGRMTASQKDALQRSLTEAGFALIDDKASALIEQIKSIIIQQVHHTEEPSRENFSTLISKALHQDYSALSRLFSETEGITIEQYTIQQKIERVKELMVYDELSLSQIAFDMGYSSVAHLSAQFKKVTGMTPSYFKSLQQKSRKGLDEVGNP